jgi:hypothetical protein
VGSSHLVGNNAVFFCLCAGAAHQEAAERVHALHEGDAARGAGGVHAQGIRRHQPDPRSKGQSFLFVSFLSFLSPQFFFFFVFAFCLSRFFPEQIIPTRSFC